MKKQNIIELIKEAQDAIGNLPCGGIGPKGATQAEIDAADYAGQPYDDDAFYHQGQKAWLLLQQALEQIRTTAAKRQAIESALED